jgi:hypothetical protein
MIFADLGQYKLNNGRTVIEFHPRSISVNGTAIPIDNVSKLSIRQKRRKIWPLVVGSLLLLSAPGPIIENSSVGYGMLTFGIIMILPYVLIKTEMFVEIQLNSGSPIHIHAKDRSDLDKVREILHQKLDTGEPSNGSFAIGN